MTWHSTEFSFLFSSCIYRILHGDGGGFWEEARASISKKERENREQRMLSINHPPIHPPDSTDSNGEIGDIGDVRENRREPAPQYKPRTTHKG